MFDTIGMDKDAINNPELRFFMQNNVALVLCIIGAVFSAMWIMMAKGSKAWYERYERALNAFPRILILSRNEFLMFMVFRSKI